MCTSWNHILNRSCKFSCYNPSKCICLQKGPFFGTFLNEGEISNWMQWLSLWFLAFYFGMTYISSSLNCMNYKSTAWKVLMCSKCLFLDKRAILSTIKYINNLFWFSWCNIISINLLCIVLYFFKSLTRSVLWNLLKSCSSLFVYQFFPLFVFDLAIFHEN